MIELSKILETKINLNSLNFPGVYFLIRRNIIIYVGSSIQIGTRLISHKIKGIIPFDSFNYVKFDDLELMRMEEKRLIIEIRPKFNFYVNPDSQNIRRILFQEVINKYKKVSHFIKEHRLTTNKINCLFDLEKDCDTETLKQVYDIIAPNGIKKGKRLFTLALANG